MIDNNLKTSDLAKEFHGWETNLNKLDGKEKIKEFQQQIWQEIKAKKDKSYFTDNSKNNKDTGISLPTKIAVGGLIFIVVVVLVGVIWWKKDKIPPKYK